MLNPVRRMSWTTLAAGLFASLAVAAPASAADGDLDATFGSGGIADVGRDSEVIDIARQSDGRIVVTGQVPGGNAGGYVARLLPDGSVDTSFGSGGYISIVASGRALAVQPDDKIVVAGNLNPEEAGDAVVYRFNADGTPDTSFSGDGRVEFDYAGEEASQVEAVAVQPNRRIVVAGTSSSNDFHVARLKIDGTPDTSFSGDGFATEDLGPGDDVSSVVLQGSRIVVAGSTNLESAPAPTLRLAVLALTSDGIRDPSFGPAGSGVFVDGSPAKGFEATAMTVTQDGGLLLTGIGPGDGSPVLKLDAAGKPDTAFSGDGWQTVALDQSGGSVGTTDDGNYVVGGSAFVDGAFRFAVVKLSPSGDLVASFGNGGRGVYAPGAVQDLERQPNGKLLVGVINDSFRMQVARIQDSGSTDAEPTPSLPILTLTGGRAIEGQILPFTATLSRPSDQPVSFNYVTGEGLAATDRDFGGRSGSATIPAGQTSVAIGIPTNPDRFFEPDEDFRVELSNPVNARLGEYVAFGSIVNDLRPGRCANVVIGRNRTDILTGSAGGDKIVGRQDIDFLYGFAGGDCIYGERGGDIIDAGEGDDLVDGGSGNDRIKGGDGNDRLYGRRGRNRYNAGAGNDRVYARNGVAEIVECGPGRDTVKADSRDRLRRCERVTR